MKQPEGARTAAMPPPARQASRAHNMATLAKNVSEGSVTLHRVGSPGSPGDLLRNHEQDLKTRGETRAAELLKPRDPAQVFVGPRPGPAAATGRPQFADYNNAKIAKSNVEWLALQEAKRAKSPTPARFPSPTPPSAATRKTPPSPRPRNQPYPRSRLDPTQVRRSRLIYDCTLSDKENILFTPPPPLPPDSFTIEPARGRSGGLSERGDNSLPSPDSTTVTSPDKTERGVHPPGEAPSLMEVFCDVLDGDGGGDGIGRYDYVDDEDELPRPVVELLCEEDFYTPDEMEVPCGLTREEEEAFRMEETAEPHLIGLPNPSSRCWLNASLQCLMSLDPFVGEVKSAVAAHSLAGGQLPTSKILRTFLYLVSQRAQGKVYKVHKIIPEFHQSLRSLDPELASDRQQDVSEFLVRFCDFLREEFVRLGGGGEGGGALRERQLNNGGGGDGGGGLKERGGGGEGDREAAVNPVEDNLTATIVRRITCEGCQTVTPGEERVQMIEVSPSNSGSIQEALNKSMKSETVDRNCSCGATQSVTTSAIQRLPRFLILHVNRYQVDAASRTTKKLSNTLRIPEWLTVEHVTEADAAQPPPWTPTPDTPDNGLSGEEPFLDSSLIADCEPVEDLDEDMRIAIQLSLESEQQALNKRLPPSVENTPTKEHPDAPCDGSSTNCYHLSAVISHIGTQTSKGHYTADVFNYAQNNWYQYNDLNVTEVTVEQVTNRDRRANGYVFFYAHKTVYHQMLPSFH